MMGLCWVTQLFCSFSVDNTNLMGLCWMTQV